MNPLCVLTGHFTVPPGRDPWTGLRHDYSPQESYQDQWIRWNKACYGANSASRILNAEGRIRSIVNNFRFLNFSVSPALLDELRQSSPNVYRRMCEADAQSLAQWGHGNAMARPWTEAILPLLTSEQLDLEIEWGLAAFRHHFGRDAEGFCLPYDAVNTAVADRLISFGIRFILLSGPQAEGTMLRGAGSWTSLQGRPAPGDRAYLWDRPEGSLAVFFPDHRLSHGLVNDGLLRDAHRLDSALRQAVQATGFIHLATSGETFGLTEPFADMCLAALWDCLSSSSPVEVVNYGYVLEQKPPRELVKVSRGADERGSSGSCPHGVSRWFRDCGCRTTVSTQGWKEPLGQILNRWSEKLRAVWQDQLAGLGLTLKDLESHLPGLILGTEAPRDWARERWGRVGRMEEDLILSIARGVQGIPSFRYSGLFSPDDPSDSQAKNAFLAVLRTFDFAPEEFVKAFLDDLESIRIQDGRTLAQFFEAEVLPKKHGPRFAAAILLLDRILRPRARYQDALGIFRVVDFSRSRHEIDDAVFRYTGQLRLHDAELDRNFDLEYLLLEDHREGVSLYLKDADSVEKPEAFDLPWLPVGDREEIVHLMGNDLETNLASETQAIFPLLRKSLVYARLLGVPPLPLVRSMMELAVTRKILAMTEGIEPPNSEVMESLEEELTFAKDYQLHLDRDRLNGRFSGWLAQAMIDPQSFASETVVKSVETLLAALGRWGFHPELTVAQSLVFETLQSRSPELLKSLENGRVEALAELKRLLRLGTLLWIDTSELKNRLLEN